MGGGFTGSKVTPIILTDEATLTTHGSNYAEAFKVLLDVQGESITVNGFTVNAIINRHGVAEGADEEGLEKVSLAEISVLRSAVTPAIGHAVVFDSLTWYVTEIRGRNDGVYVVMVSSDQTMTRGRESYYKG